MENEHANDNRAKTAEPGITRCGFVAIIGAPNAGKSTLMNQLVGAKVSIVSHKVQTTRAIVRGIAIHERAQIVFVDTPGIFAEAAARPGDGDDCLGWAGDADLIVLMVDVEREREEDLEQIMAGLSTQGRKAILVLNKIDAVSHDKLLKMAARLNESGIFDQTFMISALSGNGVGDLRRYIAERMPEGPWHYPEDQAADVPLRSLAAEVTREKLFLRLHDELPYSLTVETESWETKKDGSIRIQQVIYVERDSQKKIALGKGGQTIKTVGQLAREELQEMLETKVHLFLFVKVRENWSDDRERYREMGLDFPKD